MTKFQPVFKVLRRGLSLVLLVSAVALVANFRELPKSTQRPNEVSNAEAVVLSPMPGWLTAPDGDPFALAPHAADPVYSGTYLSIISPYVTNTR